MRKSTVGIMAIKVYCGFPVVATMTRIADTRAIHQALQEALLDAIRWITD